MHVIGYLRVSTEEQARSGLGLDAQRQAITRYADLMGWTVEWIADEGWSGAAADRPGLSLALDMLARREAQALVVAKLDRLSRSVHDFSGMLQHARKQQWSVVALDLSIDTTTLTGQLVANILMAVSEWERGAIGQRTSEALRAKAARGEPVGRPVALSDAAHARITALRAQGLSYRRIADTLNAESVPTAHGGQTWHPTTVARVLRRDERTTRQEATA